MKKGKILVLLLLLAMAVGLFACDPAPRTVNYGVINYNGTLTAIKSNKEFESGTAFMGNGIFKITFTALPDEGWQIKEWKRNGEIVKDDNDLTYKNLTYKITTKASDWDAAVKGTLNISIEFEEITI